MSPDPPEPAVLVIPPDRSALPIPADRDDRSRLGEYRGVN